MILPQLEEDRHGVDVLGIFFFNANTYMLKKGDPKGERLATIAKEKGMLLIMKYLPTILCMNAKEIGSMSPLVWG